jgi:hypothetical protein
MGPVVEWAEEPRAEAENWNGCRIELLSESRLAVRCCDESTVVLTVPRGGSIGFETGWSPADQPVLRSRHQGIDAVEIGTGSEATELPLRLAGGEFALVLVAVASGGGGELRLTQRRGDGELSAGFTIMT